MQKMLLSAVAVLASALALHAETTTVKTIYSGEPHNVTWDNTLTIPAEEFKSDVAIGNYISIAIANPSETIEIKANGTWLPGSRYCPLGDATEFKAYITTGMLAALKEYGLEICGASFTVNSVSIMDDGFQMPADAIWGGYFWVENWNTLELWKSAFDSYDNEDLMTVNISDDNGDNTGYFMKVMTSWEDSGLWAANDAISHKANCAEISLKNINVKESLANTDRVMIQANPEGGNPFNLTSVTLSNSTLSNISAVVAAATDLFPAKVYNLQGIAVATVASEAETASLPAGIYILNGKKIAVR